MAAFVSLLAAGVGALWSARPSSFPFGSADRVKVSVTHLIEHRASGAMLLAAAVVGLLVAAVVARAGSRVAAVRVAGMVAVAEAVFFALVMSDVSLMTSLGYGIALVGPVVVVAAVVIASVRGHRGGYVAAAATGAAAVVGVMTGVVEPGTLPRYAGNVIRAFASYNVRIGWGLGMAAVAAGWGWVAYRLLRHAAALGGGDPARPAWTEPESVRRWGRVATIGAALCPLPYALLRMTWLTPWPVDLDPRFDESAVRVHGASLGLAAVVGTVLTLGLIRRWGEVVPRWAPWLGGRRVPPMVAVVPGGLVATAACMASPGFVLSSVESDGNGSGLGGVLLGLLLFPFPVWGPLLGAAVVAYWLRRRDSDIRT